MRIIILLVVGLLGLAYGQVVRNWDFESVYSDTMYYEPIGYGVGEWSSSATFDYYSVKYGSVRPRRLGNSLVAEIDAGSFLVYKLTNLGLSMGTYNFSCRAHTASSVPDTGKVYVVFSDNGQVVGSGMIEVPSSNQGMQLYSIDISTSGVASDVYIIMVGGNSVGSRFHVDNLTLPINIPNGDFESWRPVVRAMPDGWYSSLPGVNVVIDTLISSQDTSYVYFITKSVPSAVADTGGNAYSGKSAMKLVPTFYVGDRGYAVGSAAYGGFRGDMFPKYVYTAINDTLDSMSVYIKVNPGVNNQLSRDSVMIILGLKNQSNERVFIKTVSLGDLSTTNYSKVVLDITAFQGSPDSILLGFLVTHSTTSVFYDSSYPYVYVDDILFYSKGSVASVEDIFYTNNIRVYVLDGRVRVDNLLSVDKELFIRFYNLAGVEVYSTEVYNGEALLPSLPSGVYVYRLFGKDNELLKVGKVIIY